MGEGRRVRNTEYGVRRFPGNLDRVGGRREERAPRPSVQKMCQMILRHVKRQFKIFDTPFMPSRDELHDHIRILDSSVEHLRNGK